MVSKKEKKAAKATKAWKAANPRTAEKKVKAKHKRQMKMEDIPDGRPDPKQIQIFRAYQDIFTGTHATLRSLPEIQFIVQEHWEDLKHKTKKLKQMHDVVQCLHKLLVDGWMADDSKQRRKYGQKRVGKSTKVLAAEARAKEARATGKKAIVVGSFVKIDKGLGPYKHVSSTPIRLPPDMQRALLYDTQILVEKCCFRFFRKWAPELLNEAEWEDAADAELNMYAAVTSELVLPAHAMAFGKRDLTRILWRIGEMRHAATHRLKISVQVVSAMLKDLLLLAKGLRDDDTAAILQLRYDKVRAIADEAAASNIDFKNKDEEQNQRIIHFRTIAEADFQDFTQFSTDDETLSAGTKEYTDELEVLKYFEERRLADREDYQRAHYKISEEDLFHLAGLFGYRYEVGIFQRSSADDSARDDSTSFDGPLDWESKLRDHVGIKSRLQSILPKSTFQGVSEVDSDRTLWNSEGTSEASPQMVCESGLGSHPALETMSDSEVESGSKLQIQLEWQETLNTTTESPDNSGQEIQEDSDDSEQEIQDSDDSEQEIQESDDSEQEIKEVEVEEQVTLKRRRDDFSADEGEEVETKRASKRSSGNGLLEDHQGAAMADTLQETSDDAPLREVEGSGTSNKSAASAPDNFNSGSSASMEETMEVACEQRFTFKATAVAEEMALLNTVEDADTAEHFNPGLAIAMHETMEDPCQQPPKAEGALATEEMELENNMEDAGTAANIG